VHDEAKSFEAHADFIVVTKPLEGHNLCGELEYKPYFENGFDVEGTHEDLDPNGPLKYDPDTKVFTIETDEN
jgi:hypothetical protein